MLGDIMKYVKDVKIYSENNEGCGICKVNNIVTFVPFSLKGELVDINITKENKKFNIGEIIKINKVSENRLVPSCKYYYKCGGCNLMHQKYSSELEFKRNKVINNLKHIGNIEINNLEIVNNKRYEYRNHVVLNVKGDKIGFYKNNTNEIVDINLCLISNKKINDVINNIRKFIGKYKNNNIDKISIKAYDNVLINITSNNFNLLNEFKNIVKYDSLYINDLYKDGIKKVSVTLDKYKYLISSKSFFKKNTYIANEMFKYIKSLVDKNEKILDLYCGTGSIGIYLSDKVSSVIGIEEVNEAIIDAKENAKINNITNIEFISGKVEENIEKFKKIDTIIVDPPRVGVSKKVINNILNINPKKLIYVSCNSSTLARDLKLLENNYEIKSIKLFDMFPNTYHVECVCILKLK